MSRVNVKFNYNNVYTHEVHETFKGPIKLDNVYQSYTNPELFVSNANQPTKILPQIRSAESLVNIPLSTVQSNYSEKPFPVSPSKKVSLAEIRETIPEQEISKSFENKEQSKQNLNNLKVKQVDRTSIESSDSNIILKAPKLSYTPIMEGEEQGLKNIRKQYTKVDNVSKYEYKGIPQKSQDDFVGCCGCGTQKQVSYKAQSPVVTQVSYKAQTPKAESQQVSYEVSK